MTDVSVIVSTKANVGFAYGEVVTTLFSVLPLVQRSLDKPEKVVK